MPKIIGNSIAAHRQHVRAKVFEVLGEQLHRNGFDAITLTGLAAEAGVGRTAMYNHFPDKETLLIDFVEAQAGQYVERLRSTVGVANNAIDKLSAFARLQLHALADYHLPSEGWLSTALTPTAYKRIAAHTDPITTTLREILVEGINSGAFVDEDTELLIPLIMSTLSDRQVVTVPADRLDRTVEAAVRFVLRAAVNSDVHGANGGRQTHQR